MAVVKGSVIGFLSGKLTTPVQTATVAADKVTITMVELNTKVTLGEDERDLSANGLICYSDPIDPNDKPFEMISFNDELSAYDPELPYTLEHN
ncbi:MAG TPA: hypothetical protein VLB50_00775 [Ignavibacteriaceae bacterium]|nr:hypothetical protein [Ignavibacteriaceae bacterium]